MMKKLLPLALILFMFLFFASLNSALAQITLPTGSLPTTVQASVGEFYLSLAGYIAPNASIVLTVDGVFARATVADRGGNFYITDTLIKRGATKICLDAIDFKRIGESLACFNIPPVKSSLNIKEIFLPPTLGISRTEIAEGSNYTVFGYSMPGDLVTLYLSNGKTSATTSLNFSLIQPAFALSSAQMISAGSAGATSINPYDTQIITNKAFVGGNKLTVNADQSGYYAITVKDVRAGIYSMYAKAELNHKQSLDPVNKLKLKSLTWWEQFIAFIRDLWDKFLKFLKDLALGPLWLIIPILILIIILLVKLLPGRFGFLRNPFGKKKPLHHKWWMGY
jgi:hypothetical protein